MKIEEICINDRPRERALSFGLSALSNAELLALFIRSGYKGTSAIDIANEILYKHSFRELSQLSVTELSKIKGISKTKAIEILATFEIGKRLTKERIYDNDLMCIKDDLDAFLIRSIGSLKQEHVLGIYLNLHNRIIDIKTLFIGTIDSSTFNPREVFKAALDTNASKVLIAHNHPSGGDFASSNDIYVTQELLKIGKAMGIVIVDHLIVTQTKVISILNNRWI